MNSNITGPEKLDDEHIFQVHEFCLKCKNLNYVNNDSLKSMKWTEADWFAHFIDDKIVSTQVFDKKFVCDLNACKGACCVDGYAFE